VSYNVLDFDSQFGMPRASMPRVCPRGASQPFLRCHGLAPWSFTMAPTDTQPNPSRCHGLVPWSFTMAPTKTRNLILPDATGLSRGVSRLQLDSVKREPPRDKPVASGACVSRLGSDQRETPRDKPVASSTG